MKPKAHFPVAVASPAERTKTALITMLDELVEQERLSGYREVGWRKGYAFAFTIEFDDEKGRTLAYLSWKHHDHAPGGGGDREPSEGRGGRCPV